MKEYLVVWEINIDADSPQEAVDQAKVYFADPEMLHLWGFKVTDPDDGETISIDLLDEPDNRQTT